MQFYKTVYFLIFSIIIFQSCKDTSIPYYKIEGPTMGTKYHITAQTDNPKKLQQEVDSILNDFNNSMSAYIDSSTLSMFNASENIFCYDTKVDPYFEPIFLKSKEIYAKTNGAFNPSIAPLVNYYGFGYKEKKKLAVMDTSKIREILKLLVFNTLKLEKYENGKICILKPNKAVMLDFNSLSPGFVCDVLAKYFEQTNIKNFMIDVSGEIRTLGVNDRKQPWVIGINKPIENAAETDVELPLELANKSMATSGNYRNTYESKGQKFAHIINPFTGMSQPTDILSATVIADDCVDADAYATAFMVLGLEKSLELVEQLNGIEACFIYDNEGDGIFEFKISSGFAKYYLHNEQK